MIEFTTPIPTPKECFCLGKTGDEALCEDVIVIGDAYLAVIDGVTSKSKITYNGKKGGRYAAELLADAIRALDPKETADGALNRLDEVIRNANPKGDVPPEDRLQACVILYSHYRRQIWCYGDCQCMINGVGKTHAKEVDNLFASVRAFVIAAYLKQGGDPDALYEHDVGREAVLPFLKVQSLFANSDEPFGYPVLNGTGINKGQTVIYSLKPGDHVVLASDGYPKLFPTLTESEENLQRILATDPLSIGENRETKLKVKGNLSFDDRSYLSFYVT